MIVRPVSGERLTVVYGDQVALTNTFPVVTVDPGELTVEYGLVTLASDPPDEWTPGEVTGSLDCQEDNWRITAQTIRFGSPPWDVVGWRFLVRRIDAGDQTVAGVIQVPPA